MLSGSGFAHLPLCLQWGEGPVCRQLPLLWYLLNPLFCEWARLCLRLELFIGKFSLSFSFFSLWLFHSFDCYFTLATSDFPQGIQALSMQPMPPCLAPACWWQTQTSGLLLHWELRLGAYTVDFFFSSQFCCPLRFQNSPQTPQ